MGRGEGREGERGYDMVFNILWQLFPAVGDGGGILH